MLTTLVRVAYTALQVKAAVAVGYDSGRNGEKRLYIYAGFVDYPIATREWGSGSSGQPRDLWKWVCVLKCPGSKENSLTICR